MKRLHLCVEVIEWLPDWTFPMYLGVGDSGETRRQKRHLDVSIGIRYYNMRVWVRSLHIGSSSLKCLDLLELCWGPCALIGGNQHQPSGLGQILWMVRWPCAEMGSWVLHKAVFFIILIVIYNIYIYIYYTHTYVYVFFTHVLECCVWHVSARCFFLLDKRNIDERNRCKTEMVFNPKYVH